MESDAATKGATARRLAAASVTIALVTAWVVLRSELQTLRQERQALEQRVAHLQPVAETAEAKAAPLRSALDRARTLHDDLTIIVRERSLWSPRVAGIADAIDTVHATTDDLRFQLHELDLLEPTEDGWALRIRGVCTGADENGAWVLKQVLERQEALESGLRSIDGPLRNNESGSADDGWEFECTLLFEPPRKVSAR